MKKRVAIICGGRSSEHEISCTSAGGVLSAIDRNAYEPVLIGISKSGKWFLLAQDHPLSINGTTLPTVPETGIPVTLSVDGFSADGKNLNIDIAFPVLHGPYGEDGTIQGLFEMADIPYVGSGVLASAVAMDKSFAKPIFASHGIKVATGFVARASDWQKDKAAIQSAADKLGYPVFVKPARGGSSRGTTKVKSAAEFGAALDEVKTRYRWQTHDFVHGENFGVFHHAVDHEAMFGRIDVPPTLVVPLKVQTTGRNNAKQGLQWGKRDRCLGGLSQARTLTTLQIGFEFGGFAIAFGGNALT